MELNSAGKKVYEVAMPDAVSFLEERIESEKVLWVVVAYAGESGILSLLRFPFGNRHCHLDVVVFIPSAGNEIAFEIAYPAHAHVKAFAFEMRENQVFENGAIVDASVGVPREIDTSVGKVVFPAATEGLARFEIEALARIEDARLFKNVKISP